MALAPYSIPKQPHASELYSCEHENVSVYRSAHILIMDHIRHTHRHTKGSTDMNKRTSKFIEALRSLDLGEGVNPTVIVREDDEIMLSAEEYDGLVIDPYGDMEIHADVEALARKHKFDLEFESAGAIIAYAY